jgi:hypothetical protein
LIRFVRWTSFIEGVKIDVEAVGAQVVEHLPRQKGVGDVQAA